MNRIIFRLLPALFLWLGSYGIATALDDHNPVGAMGTFEGVVTTGCAYNVLNHGTLRAIDDIVMPGSIGKYPLKMTRYYVSRDVGDSRMGPGWRHEYSWNFGDGKVEYANGNVWDNSCNDPVGVSDEWEVSGQRFRLADGGTVVFDGQGRESQIIDPYGQTTNITYAPDMTWMRVTEPGGRYLYFVYTHQPVPNGALMLTTVEAHGLGNGTVTDWVNYTYASQPTGGNIITTAMCLTRADYSDGTSATYTYEPDNAPEDPTHGSSRMYPPVSTCNDVRYHGLMRRIAYDYQQGGPHGAITAERYSNSDGNKGIAVSSIPGNLPSPVSGGQAFYFPTDFTETRGDVPSRAFHYSSLHMQRHDNVRCPDVIGTAPSQFLLNYTDFQGHTTWIGYDPVRWYATHVTDARGAYDGDVQHTTNYDRGPNIGEITKITHPDGTHIDYVYDDAGHYVHTVSNERQKVTTYTRDPTTHLVTQIDYPQDANTPASSEVFTYNPFGQVLTHQLKNGAWESFVYDTNNRGLLTDKYNPKQTGVPTGSDPHTHYTYYTSGPWTDRVLTVTLPGNFPNGLQASETYEYDRTLGGDGTTDPLGAAVAGRGLVTKITHGDNTWQSFGYDKYGNKRWEENELRQRTSYTYDHYNRLLTVTNPLNKTTTYDYSPTEGNITQSQQHTSNSPYWITTPANIKTHNVYDENWRRTSTTAAYGTLNPTVFAYDNVGNLTQVTDPLSHLTVNGYDSRNRKITTTEASGTNLARTTTWHYDEANNIYQIDRPDSTQETKTFDAMNRVLTDTVPKTANPVVNIVTTFNYNPSGTLNWVRDGENHQTSFTYDASDQKTLMTYDGNTATQQWFYDDAHNLKYRVTVNNETQFFYYDIRNYKYATWWSNWANNIVDWRYFGYDAAGRLTEAENGTGGWNKNIISDIHRTYDAAGHLTLDQQIVTGLGTENVNYPTYDNDGRLTQMYASGVSGGYDFTYSYDFAGRFEKIFVTGQNNPLFQYHYDAASNETQRDNLFNGIGVTQVYPPDALNRIQYVDVTRNGNLLGHEGYTYDPMNRITLVDYGNGHTDSLVYYLDGELNQAQLGNFNRNVTYNLDKAGNRMSVVDTGVTKSYAPNNLNQYTTGESMGVTNGPEHEIQSFNGVTYTYMNDERLSSAVTNLGDGGNSMYQLVYDALGRCVKRSLNGLVTYYVYDSEKPILEYAAGGASVGVNVYGKAIDEILERVAIGSDAQWHTYFFQQNHEGSVTHLIDTGGNVIERYRYDTFGAPTIYDGNWNVRWATIYNNRFLFTGREYAATYRSTYNTPAFNFYEYRARAYNPALGRFMSEDPKLFDAGDYNLFRYCHNDPIDFTDAMGTQEQYHDLLAQVREAVQQALRQAAQQRARAHAYSGGNFEGGTSFIGTANFHMAQVTKQGADPKTFRSELAAANAHKAETLSLMERDKKEYGAEFFQKPDGSENYIAGKPRSGTGVKYFNNDRYGRKGWYQTFVPNRNAEPPKGYEGYEFTGFYYGHLYHDPSMWQIDKGVAHDNGMNAVLFMPRQHGDNRPAASLYYNHDDPP